MGDQLKGKVALVTGAGRGIGRGIALALVEEGCKVVVNDHGVNPDGTGFDKGPADEAVAEVKQKGGEAVANYDTVATFQGGENMVKQAVDVFGRIDIVVHNAGILRDRMLWNMTEEEWDAVYSVHLKGCFNVCKPAAALFRQQRGGRIIAMSSTSGLWGNSGQTNYAAAKDGIAGFVRVAARDLGRYGVTVNCIAPSASTRLTATVTPQAREARARAGVQMPGGNAQMTMAQLMARGNPPEGVAPIIVYLCTDHAANINGQIFFAREGLIGIMNQPATWRTISKNGRWTFAELAAAFPMTLGRDLANPAPPQPAQPDPASQQAAPAQQT